MFRARFLILAGLLMAGCGSSPQPTAPVASATLSPAPAPGSPTIPMAPLIGVPEINTIHLSTPAPPSASTDPLVGRYSLDVAVTSDSGFRCETVPAQAKRRTYTADVTYLADQRYAVQLSDARFLRDFQGRGYGCTDRRLDMRGVCHQFLIYSDSPSAVSVSIVPEDEWRGSEIWEVLPAEGRLLAFTGLAYGSAANGQIRATGNGSAWYGNGLPASEYGACQGNLSLTFTRR